ncbi:hypothetical protein A3224_06355 [Microbulbifer thermotolerans]|uniref:Phytase-like domain-containing protein n=1 Tax=Microbulbifer thermotolerans TaxID=252514 RepID=A0A143HKK4_MICTH|nr:hypothetical protein A3224_06355 [Microbulbifer thermotolerans]
MTGNPLLRYLILSILWLSPFAAASSVTPAQLLSAYWVDNSPGLDISGLTFCHGTLLAVSDKNSSEIYALELSPSGAALKAYQQVAGLAIPEEAPGGFLAALSQAIRPDTAMDFEGISCDSDGVYLVSERYSRIAQLTVDGAAWLAGDWVFQVRRQGYLQKVNAGTEGLVRIGSDFWVAMEREPRGLLHLPAGGEAQVFPIPAVAGLDFRGRAEDITGLAHYDGALFTLERNAFAVCRRALRDLRAEWCIDYRAIEESPEFVYTETRYGKGEGLAVDASGIYVVLDNNNVGRAADTADKRALLLHLAFPAEVR